MPSSCLRALLLASLTALALVGAESGRDAAFEAYLFGWEFGPGSQLSAVPDQPSALINGVRIHYEKVVIACDRLEFSWSTAKGEERLIDHGELSSGPHGLDPDHVVLDSSTSKLPQVGFRGVLRPTHISMQRAHEAVDGPNGLRYIVRLDGIQGFSGTLVSKEKSTPIVGWADSAEIVLIGDLANGRVDTLRMHTFNLFGRPATDARPLRKAALVELNPERAPDPTAVDIDEITTEPTAGVVDDDPKALWAHREWAMALTLDFGDGGRFQNAHGDGTWRGQGLPSWGSRKPTKLSLDR